MSTTRTFRLIRADAAKVYEAFTEPAALAHWLPPGGMTGTIHSFDARVGGGYQMSLFYPETETTFRGKTADREDRFTVRFIELVANRKIVEAVTFDSDDPAFSGEMRIEILLEASPPGTAVTFSCSNIPRGIRPEDNDAGARMSLEQLARFLES